MLFRRNFKQIADSAEFGFSLGLVCYGLVYITGSAELTAEMMKYGTVLSVLALQLSHA